MLNSRQASLKELMVIPGVGKSIANDLYNIGIRRVADLKRQHPDSLYDASNKVAGPGQDRWLVYVLRCAVYYAKTSPSRRKDEKLKWWNWKDTKK